MRCPRLREATGEVLGRGGDRQLPLSPTAAQSEQGGSSGGGRCSMDRVWSLHHIFIHLIVTRRNEDSRFQVQRATASCSRAVQVLAGRELHALRSLGR